jgi:predicted transcriptional regulator
VQRTLTLIVIGNQTQTRCSAPRHKYFGALLILYPGLKNPFFRCKFENPLIKYTNMNAIELKTDLHRLIENIDDVNVLEAVRVLLASQIPATDWWYEISEEERAEIEEGLSQADRGETKTTEEVLSKYQQWDSK